MMMTMRARERENTILLERTVRDANPIPSGKTQITLVPRDREGCGSSPSAQQIGQPPGAQHRGWSDE
ncbi:hypothetical protein AG1IA_00970 [Rhizoctonia solani AG-1 IA]|uniref:Uncharacterized protein n=1 Tax=Thanatephorus cucumeris (strain AG1-IA) TaxID=983506 RepID=L8X472_THACA|nr:hypothetical protein AG1IA_00970 [Rhizoctonia solani AG-1 IA]